MYNLLLEISHFRWHFKRLTLRWNSVHFQRCLHYLLSPFCEWKKENLDAKVRKAFSSSSSSSTMEWWKNLFDVGSTLGIPAKIFPFNIANAPIFKGQKSRNQHVIAYLNTENCALCRLFTMFISHF